MSSHRAGLGAPRLLVVPLLVYLRLSPLLLDGQQQRDKLVLELLLVLELVPQGQLGDERLGVVLDGDLQLLVQLVKGRDRQLLETCKTQTERIHEYDVYKLHCCRVLVVCFLYFNHKPI